MMNCAVNVLIIIHSARLRNTLYDSLCGSGFAVDFARDGTVGYECALNNQYDVIIIDFMPPEFTGLDVLSQLRIHGIKNNILMLSTNQQADGRIEALKLLTDDYLEKPAKLEKIVVLIHDLIRRELNQSDQSVSIGGLSINTALHEVRVKNKTVSLTPTEQLLIEQLVLCRGQVLPSDQLETLTHQPGLISKKNTIEVHISALRRKLRRAGCDALIKTRRGFGYYID